LYKNSFMTNFKSICESRNIGEGSKIGAFAHIKADAIIGKNCDIFDYVSCENDVIVGDRVTIKSNVYLIDGIRIGNDVHIGPNVSFCSQNLRDSHDPGHDQNNIFIDDGVFIGANATILSGVQISRGAMVSAGAVVTKNVPAGAIVTGHPAQIDGYVNQGHERLQTTTYKKDLNEAKTGLIGELHSGSILIKLPEVIDLRGRLTFAEVEQFLPFNPLRYFLVYGVPTREVRGEHAHRECHQFLVCVSGALTVITDNGVTKDQILLNTPNIGLHIPPKIWGIQFNFTPDAVLLVLASDRYDPDDYIREYRDFLILKGVK
jgi:UDP-2-acetamido-3-amino-2,3-dideoxy-glucuronate N-acetyltransferase